MKFAKGCVMFAWAHIRCGRARIAALAVIPLCACGADTRAGGSSLDGEGQSRASGAAADFMRDAAPADDGIDPTAALDAASTDAQETGNGSATDGEAGARVPALFFWT